jgi:predicted RNA-binding protein with PIN domain
MTPPTVWIVDGMNVIGSRPDGWWRDRDAAMAALVERLGAFAASTGEPVTVVFERPPAGDPTAPGVEVTHAPRPGRDAADDEIEQLLALHPAPESVHVVTSDRALADRVRALGAEVVGAAGFRAQLED